MQGHGRLRTVPYMSYDPATKALHDKILDAKGIPRTNEQVRIVAYSGAGKDGTGAKKQGPLTMGYGSALGDDDVCGPELAFGITMQELLGEPVLLIKTSWGGKSLNTDFRPPSAGRYKLSAKTQEAWDKHSDGAHGIPGKSDRKEWWAKKDKATGHYYRLMIKHVKETLADVKEYHPAYDPDEGYELAGLVWFQGWNDMCDGGTYPDSKNPGGYAQYTELMAHFIRDVRKELNAPEMKVVIGVIGVGGDKASGGIANLRPAMAAPAEMDEFKGTVAAVQTKDFWDYKMEELQGKRGRAEHRLRAAHLIGEDGWMEPRDTGVPSWQVVGSPTQEERVWRYTSIDPTSEKDRMAPKEKKRFRDIKLPSELKDWYKPEFDDSKWETGKAPIGKGAWKHRDAPMPKSRSEWGDGEFLLMRTTFTVDELNYDAYRLAAFSRQGYHVYLNGHKLQTYIWWKDQPYYMVWEISDDKAKYLKEGENVLAVYANCEYQRKTAEAFGAVDMVIEGITDKDFEYVNSVENKLRLMDKECTREEGRIIMGCSNGGYHYLGSAKMLSQIGQAFGEAMMEMHSAD
jgi:alpha-galactosidase